MLQKFAITDELPKIYAVQSTMISLLFGIWTLSFGAIAELWDVNVAFILAATLLGLGTLFALIRRRDFIVTTEK